MRESYRSKIDALCPSPSLFLSAQHILGTLTRSHQRHFPMLVQLVVAKVFTKSEQTCILATSLLYFALQQLVSRQRQRQQCLGLR